MSEQVPFLCEVQTRPIHQRTRSPSFISGASAATLSTGLLAQTNWKEATPPPQQQRCLVRAGRRPGLPGPLGGPSGQPRGAGSRGPAARRDGLRLGAVTGTRPLRPLLPASNARLPHRRQRRTSRPKGKCDPSHTRVERPSEDQLVMTLLCPTLHKPLHGTPRSLLHSCLVFTKLLERGHIQTTSAEHST